MSLLETLNNDMIVAMKNKDSFTLGVIRLVKGAIQLEQINKKTDLTDDEVISVVAKQIKMRKDSISEFAKANRDDLIQKNEHEIAILNKYMPKQLTDSEIDDIINEVFLEVKPQGPKDMGIVMKSISPKLKGKADMGKVNVLIKEKLSNLQ